MVALVIVGVAGAAAYLYERPRVTTVAFQELAVDGGLEGLTNSPVAPEGFPDCTIDMLDTRVERNANLTVRPKEGVQCGIEWSPPAWWVDAKGVRHDPRPSRDRHVGRLLLMGAAGASDTGGVETACGLEDPLTYFIEIGGEPFKVGTIEKTECWGGNRKRFYPAFWLYRGGGLETPAGWLDPTIEDLEATDDGTAFTLELRNDTDDTITLSRCPFIDARIVTEATAESDEPGYRTWLNCPAAPDNIEPGDVVRFELVVPGDVTTGRLELELRDEDRILHRIASEEIEVSG